MTGLFCYAGAQSSKLASLVSELSAATAEDCSYERRTAAATFKGLPCHETPGPTERLKLTPTGGACEDAAVMPTETEDVR